MASRRLFDQFRAPEGDPVPTGAIRLTEDDGSDGLRLNAPIPAPDTDPALSTSLKPSRSKRTVTGGKFEALRGPCPALRSPFDENITMLPPAWLNTRL